MVVNCFKYGLHLPVAVTKEHNIVAKSEVRHIDVDSNLNPWVILQMLTKNPIDNINEEGREECQCLPEQTSKDILHGFILLSKTMKLARITIY